jgi:3-dehydroquinate synthase
MIYTIEATNYSIEIGSLGDSSFESFMISNYKDARKIIIVDELTNDHCLEYLITSFDFLSNAEVVLLPEGEDNKVMDVCLQVWQTWIEFNIDRSAVVINLGGGVVTDMGGFMASLFKRGIDFINIPTTLLAMVDAAVGGKTGVDLNGYKNVIGVFSDPKAVFIDSSFLTTLSDGEIYSGFAEMLKHGLVVSENHCNELKKMDDVAREMKDEFIYDSVSIKNNIVLEDPFEVDLRKKLNFGHTIGHALESYFMEKDPISHGYAVVLGMLAESFISFKRNYITLTEFSEIERVIVKNYEMLDLSSELLTEILNLMLNDKKNKNGEIKGVLLIAIGESITNQEFTHAEIIDSLEYLNRLYNDLNLSGEK